MINENEPTKMFQGEIRSILLNVWDPIRVQGFREEMRKSMQDEYDRYIPPILELLRKGSDKFEFEEYLSHVEASAMGYRRIDGRAARAAQLLYDLTKK